MRCAELVEVRVEIPMPHDFSPLRCAEPVEVRHSPARAGVNEGKVAKRYVVKGFQSEIGFLAYILESNQHDLCQQVIENQDEYTTRNDSLRTCSTHLQ